MSEPEVLLSKGRYAARLATTDADVAAAKALRTLCFKTSQIDQDDHDAFWRACAG